MKTNLNIKDVFNRNGKMNVNEHSNMSLPKTATSFLFWNPNAEVNEGAADDDEFFNEQSF